MQGGGGWGPPGGPPHRGGPPPGHAPLHAPQGPYPAFQQGCAPAPQPYPAPVPPPYGPPAGGYGAPGHGPQAFGPAHGGPGQMASGFGYVTCPRCNGPHVSRPSFTWWGGLLGPKLLHHAECKGCGFGFNAKTGKSNGTAIGIYVAVCLVFVIIFGVLSILAS